MKKISYKYIISFPEIIDKRVIVTNNLCASIIENMTKFEFINFPENMNDITVNIDGLKVKVEKV